MPYFDSRPVRVGSVVSNMTMGQVTLLVLVFSTVSYEYFINLRLTLYQLLSPLFYNKTN